MIGVDLFSCAGGASEGYSRVPRVHMYGVDKAPQPNYMGPFLQMDALEVLRRLLDGERLDALDGLTLANIDFWHASPPCQDYTTLKAVHGNEWPRLIAPVRELLIATGLPYVIENVGGARRELRNPIMLCGEMFGLDVIRHRYFESNLPITAPAHIKHRGRVKGWRHGQYFDGPYYAVYGEGGGKGTVSEWQRAMDIHWTDDRREIAEAIPPAYAEHIGRQFVDLLGVARAA